MSCDNLFDVSNEIIVVTGTSGQLGSQYAGALLARGARVIGLDIASSKNSDVLRNAYPDRFFFYQASVADKESLKRVLNSILTSIGTPTVLVNNAAIDSPPSAPPEENGPFEDYPESSWDKVLDVNLKGAYLCCQVFGSAMAQVRRGSIINIASIYGLVSPDQSLYDYRRERGETFFKPVAYSVSKSGLFNLTRYLAVYWAKQDVRVNSLTIAGVFNNQDPAFLKAYCGRIPVGRMADVCDYDGSIVFLASSASRYMTGSNIVVDGGWTAI